MYDLWIMRKNTDVWNWLEIQDTGNHVQDHKERKPFNTFWQSYCSLLDCIFPFVKYFKQPKIIYSNKQAGHDTPSPFTFMELSFQCNRTVVCLVLMAIAVDNFYYLFL